MTTSNIAREASVNAGLPIGIPSHTIAQACISSNRAVCDGAEKILAGKADIFIGGGVETFSDVPIRYSRPVRKRLINAKKVMKKKGTVGGARALLKGLKAKDLAPVPPAIKNFTTQEVMGHSSDRLAARFRVSREAQDEFALRSHKVRDR